MHHAIFYILSALTLLFGALVIFNPFTRNPVTSAMFLVLTIVAMAGLFLLLHAFFLAAVQILVYAGAVMVLFLFVIMLLDLKEEQLRQVKLAMGILGLISVGIICAMMVHTIDYSHPAGRMAHESLEGSTPALGAALFTDFGLPFELVSLLLLVAVIGAVLLSRKDLR